MVLHIIPSVDFATLELQLAADGRLLYQPAPLRAFCRANGIDQGVTITDDDLAMAVIAEWYVLHREARGKRDVVADTIVAMLNARQT